MRENTRISRWGALSTVACALLLHEPLAMAEPAARVALALDGVGLPGVGGANMLGGSPHPVARLGAELALGQGESLHLVHSFGVGVLSQTLERGGLASASLGLRASDLSGRAGLEADLGVELWLMTSSLATFKRDETTGAWEASHPLLVRLAPSLELGPSVRLSREGAIERSLFVRYRTLLALALTDSLTLPHSQLELGFRAAFGGGR